MAFGMSARRRPPAVCAGPRAGGGAEGGEPRGGGGVAVVNGRSFHDEGRWVGLADALEHVSEASAILRHLDGLEGRPEEPRAGPFEDARPRAGHSEVEGRLAAPAGEEAVGAGP